MKTELHPSGERIGDRFEVVVPAGAGGAGTVYRARDLLSGGLVALKFLHEQEVSDAERFAREAIVLAELSHPGIVRYVAHGETRDGLLYLAMEWLEGETLAARLARSPLTLDETVTLGLRVAESLAAAHGRGVVHRDIKPSNLLLADGSLERVKLLDFGLARRAWDSHGPTQPGALMGTPGYMAPEQASGWRDVSPATDVFSLGAVLYECLAGEPPFMGQHIV